MRTDRSRRQFFRRALGAGAVTVLAAGVDATPVGYVNVKDAPYHARGDGVSDDTAAIQAAIDAAAQVYVPTGRYRVSSLRLRSGIHLAGSGPDAVLVHSSDVCLLTAESPGANSFVDDITLRQLQLLGDVLASGFREHTHLVAVMGVRRLKIKNCVLRGFRGDGLYLGGVNSLGDSERHNLDVTVQGCKFDGLNSDNRNAISIIDGDGVLVRGNHFHDCTRADMPGAVDIEPNEQAFHVVRNITVADNVFKHIGGNVGAVAVVLAGHAYTRHPSGFEIANNHIDGCSAAGISFVNQPAGGVGSDTPSHRLVVRDNTVVNAARGFGLTGVIGARLENNDISDMRGSNIGYLPADMRCRDVRLLSNRFLRCGSVGGVGLVAFTVDELLLESNRFEDCGFGGPGSYALDFHTGTSANVAIIGNTFIAPTGRTLVAIQKEAGHVFTPATNTFSGNELNGLPSYFQAG